MRIKNQSFKKVDNVIIEDVSYICDSLKVEFESIFGKKILITGGGGFLGYYLVKSILHWNDTVGKSNPAKLIVYDNFMRGMPDWLNSIKETVHLTVKKHDINDPLPSDLGTVDYIMHAATIASPVYYRKYPIETMDANVIGLRNLLDYCVHLKNCGKLISGFLFFSTSEIYGDPSNDFIPTPEIYRGNVSCTGPRACYDESKRYGETLCVNFSQQFDLPIKIVRPFNNYGPGLKITDKRALPDFANNVLNNKNIILFSDGSPTRTFCYISDAIIGYYKVLVNGKNGESYNIGNPTPEISILELAQIVVEISKEIFGYKGKVEHIENKDKYYLTDNPNRRCPEISKAKKDLGFNPQIKVYEGVRSSLIWYAENSDENIK